jgi:hypothetical protein
VGFIFKVMAQELLVFETTRNVVFFSLSIMDIAAYTMTLQTNCRDQTFVSFMTFRELQSVSVMDARIWRNPS